MKKIFIPAALFLGIVACNSNTSSENKSETGTSEGASASAPATDYTSDPNYQKGLEVVAKNDCGTCHEISTKKIGPAFHDVAVKYAGADEAKVDSLANKVIKGGSGHWGTVPMTPHPNLSQEDAKAAVRYVLLLKNA